MSTQYVGLLNSTPSSFSNFDVNASEPTDVFELSIDSTRNINLSLTDITGGDADLRLFRDVNANGILDDSDRATGSVGSSTRGSNSDDAINARADAGTYFAEVSRFSGSGVDNVSYNLDLSATQPALSSDFSNLLPKEFELGDLSDDVTRTGNVSNTNTADVYSFSLGFFEGVNITLDGLSSDADIRLIQDSNNNRIVDAGEVVESSTTGGISSELISNINLSGDYFLQVNQFSGNTNYSVAFDYFTTPDV